MDRKVLIAEDNPGLARVLSFKFKSAKFTPITCQNGREAWEQFQEQNVLAVISDQEMPEMTGIELCQNIRGIDKEVPLFLVTGRQIELSSNDSLNELDITQIFGKPFSPAKVVAAVEATISKNASHEVS